MGKQSRECGVSIPCADVLTDAAVVGPFVDAYEGRTWGPYLHVLETVKDAATEAYWPGHCWPLSPSYHRL